MPTSLCIVRAEVRQSRRRVFVCLVSNGHLWQENIVLQIHYTLLLASTYTKKQPGCGRNSTCISLAYYYLFIYCLLLLTRFVILCNTGPSLQRGRTRLHTST